MADLTKRVVEALLRAIDDAGDDIDGVRRALAGAGVPASLLDGGIDDLYDLAAELNETRRVPVRPELEARARAWLADDPDPETRAELEGLLAAGDGAGLAERFGDRLTFGTAGIRGPLGAGPARMNRAAVRAAVAGVARWLSDPGRGVVVGRDGRHRSDDFAEDAARVLSGAGVPALVLPAPVPTPVLAFAVRHLGAAGGLMVTASHNPPADNGVKVYGDDGAQIVPPADGIIAGAIDHIGSVSALPVSDDLVRPLGAEVLDAYVEAAAALATAGPRQLRVVHTAMHGVGWEPVRRVFARAGFDEPIAVAEQQEPDGAFPTVPFPNPEEPGALDLALALATRVDADLVLANDPDADRLGVAVPDGGAWRQLTGDEIGVLLADHVLRTTSGDDRLVACSFVSSTMLARMAAAHGVHCKTTLTGFKWIVRAVDAEPDARFVFGYEEALGYSVCDLVRDKDGITAALAFADVAARLRAGGRTVVSRLDELIRTFGLHATRTWAVRAPVAEVNGAVARLRDASPTSLAGHAVVTVGHPTPDAVVLELERGARAIVRPSGTEPKLKSYLQVVIDDVDEVDAARAAATRELEELRAALAGALGLGG